MIVGSFFNDHAVLFALVCAGVAVAYGIALTVWLLGRPDGNERMREIARAVQEGAAAYALTARIARALDEGEPLPSYPHRLIEENFWRAIRHGLSGELIDLDSGEVRPARAHLERLLEWVQPAAEELGAAQWLAIPAANSAERQIAQYEEGATMEEIYAGLARRKEPVGG